MQIHTRADVLTRKNVCTHKCMHPHLCTNACIPQCTHVHAHTHLHTHIHANVHAHSHTYMHSNAGTHNAHVCTQCIYAYMCMHTHSYTVICTQMQAPTTHTCVYAPTYAYTHMFMGIGTSHTCTHPERGPSATASSRSTWALTPRRRQGFPGKVPLTVTATRAGDRDHLEPGPHTPVDQASGHAGQSGAVSPASCGCTWHREHRDPGLSPRAEHPAWSPGSEAGDPDGRRLRSGSPWGNGGTLASRPQGGSPRMLPRGGGGPGRAGRGRVPRARASCGQTPGAAPPTATALGRRENGTSSVRPPLPRQEHPRPRTDLDRPRDAWLVV